MFTDRNDKQANESRIELNIKHLFIFFLEDRIHLSSIEKFFLLLVDDFSQVRVHRDASFFSFSISQWIEIIVHNSQPNSLSWNKYDYG